MSVNFVKIVELLKIKQVLEESFLHINFYLDEQIELYWAIDSLTAESIAAICDFDEVHKYRLSMRTKKESAANQYSSYVTKTYLSNSKRLTFSCSEEFKSQLELIKECTSAKELLRFPFLSKELPTIPEEPEEVEEEKPVKLSGESDELSEQKADDASAEPIENKVSTAAEQQKDSPKGQTEQPNEKEEVHAHEPEQKKYVFKPVKWQIIATIAALIIAIAAAFFIVKPKETVQQDPQQAEEKIMAENTVKEAPEPRLPNSIPVEEFMLFGLPEKYVALTFNEGPTDFTEQIAEILKDYKVGGTFFFVGSKAAEDPRSVLTVQSHELAIGSMTNSRVDTLSLQEQQQEITEAHTTLEKITNANIKLFRPPGALFNQDTQTILEQLGASVVLWSINPHEEQPANAEELLTAVKDSQLAGSILYLEESKEVVEALPGIIEAAQEQKLKIVSLD